MEVEADTQSMQYSTSAQVGSQRPKRKRIRNWTAEDRAVHREFEKSRREAFSERLTVGHKEATATTRFPG